MPKSVKPLNQFLGGPSRIEFVEIIVAEFNVRGIGFKNLESDLLASLPFFISCCG